MEDFRQRYTPDWDRLKELVEQAKGPNRTMREFAAQCQISPATFTRIVQKRYVKALSDDMLEKIVNNADRNSEVTMAKMKRANGFVSDEDADEEIEPEVAEIHSESSINVFEILKNELVDRGYNCMAMFSGFQLEEAHKSELFFDEFDKKEHLSSVTICVQGYEPRYRKICECFIGEGKKATKQTDYITVLGILDLYGIMFLRDTWDPESMKNIMYSFVFDDKNKFEVFTKAIANIKVNNYMSVILIDTDTKKVIEEVMFTTHSGKTIKSLFDAPYINQDRYTGPKKKKIY